MQLSQKLFLGLDEIVVNFPTLSVDVSWNDYNIDGGIIRVQTYPIVLSHGWTVFTFNVTLKNNGWENGYHGGTISSDQLVQLRQLMKQFLDGKNTILSIVGTNYTINDLSFNPYKKDYSMIGSSSSSSMAQYIASYIQPPINVGVQDRKNLTQNLFEKENPCEDGLPSAIFFHEFLFKSVYERQIRFYLNATLQVSFFSSFYVGSGGWG